jgi:hypothetical protein
LFEDLTGLLMSGHAAHDMTPQVAEGLGVLDVAPTREEIRVWIAAVSAGKTWRPVMVLAIDGGHVPTRAKTAQGRRRGRKKTRANGARWKGEWREAKGCRFYLLDEERILHVLSWHQVQNDEEMAEALRQVKAAGLIPEDQVRLCVIGDGAGWIWKSRSRSWIITIAASISIRWQPCSMATILSGSMNGVRWMIRLSRGQIWSFSAAC